MGAMSFSGFRLAVLTGITGVLGAACGDSLGLPPAAFDNVVDTTTLFALQGTPIASPSAYDMVSLIATRTELGDPFDLAFDLDDANRALIYTAPALGIPTSAALRTTSESFDRIERAPTDNYQSDSAFVVEPGTVFLARSRTDSRLCSFLGSLPRFGKFHVIAVDGGSRTVTFEHLVNVNCGHLNLTPGPNN